MDEIINNRDFNSICYMLHVCTRRHVHDDLKDQLSTASGEQIFQKNFRESHVLSFLDEEMDQ